MNGRTGMRIFTTIINIFLACAGGVISYILTIFPSAVAGGVTFATGIFALVTQLLIIIVFIIQSVSRRRSIAEYHMVLATFFLMLYLPLSPDAFGFYSYINFPLFYDVADIAGNICFICVSLSVLNCIRTDYCPASSKVHYFLIAAVGGLCAAVYAVLYADRLKIIVHAAYVLVLFVYYSILRARIYNKGSDNETFIFISFILFCMIGMHTANVLVYSGLVRHTGGITVAYMWACIFSFASAYLVFFIKIDRVACAATEYKMQNDRLKMQVLMGQVKPHFIFNAMEKVKSMYHLNESAGDKCLDLFSLYLRESLALMDTEVIPIDRELQNISRYIDFINTDRERPFEVIYDIDYASFCVPAFALHPFIENAVRYSGVDEKEGGMIVISTRRDGEWAELKITDNGAGFDVSAIKEGAHGINNSVERFRLLMGVSPVITSEAGRGTQVLIRIKCKGGKDYEDYCG